LPNDAADEGYKSTFNLTEEEYKEVKKLDTKTRQFLLKHNEDSIVAELSLEGMEREVSVLSATQERTDAMKQAISEEGKKPSAWLDSYYKKLNL